MGQVQLIDDAILGVLGQHGHLVDGLDIGKLLPDLGGFIALDACLGHIERGGVVVAHQVEFIDHFGHIHSLAAQGNQVGILQDCITLDIDHSRRECDGAESCVTESTHADGLQTLAQVDVLQVVASPEGIVVDGLDIGAGLDA